MSVLLSNKEYSSDQLMAVISRIFLSTSLCAVSTVTAEGKSYINTAYYCFNDNLDMFILSNPATEHCKNIARLPTTAVAVFDSNQPWGSDLRGLQLFGHSELAQGVDEQLAAALYQRRFQAYLTFLTELTGDERRQLASRFYVFRPTVIKIIDEARFGEEAYIVADVVRSPG